MFLFHLNGTNLQNIMVSILMKKERNATKHDDFDLFEESHHAL